MPQAQLQPVEIFAPGKHTPSSGATLSFTSADLARCAQVYDPALHRAPFVIGHPKTDDLAYGHAASLTYSEAQRRLIAAPADVEPTFAEMVGDGRLLAVSASFYTPDSPSNPVPGAYYLRHVGFLGAEPPAVKGLKRPAVNFAEAEQGVIEFADWGDRQNASLWRSVREWVISRFGLDEADKAVPAYLVDSVQESAMQPDFQDSTPAAMAFNEGGTNVSAPTPEQLAAQAAELATQRAALDARDAELRQRETAAAHAARLAEFREFTGALVTQGRLLPVQQERVLAVLASLPAAQVVEFAEGDKQVNKPAAEALQEFLKSLPVQVDFTERAGNRKPGKGAARAVDITSAASIQAAAVEFREAEAKAGRAVSIEAAVAHVIDTNPEE